MNTAESHVFEFGPFVLDTSRRMLLPDGKPVALQPKAFDMLLLLVERRDVVLTKDELLSGLWPDTFVDEATRSRCSSLNVGGVTCAAADRRLKRECLGAPPAAERHR